MKGVTMYITIETLWKKHKNKSLIARMTGHDWKTVAKRIKEIEQGKEYIKKETTSTDSGLLQGTDYKILRRESFRSEDP